MIPRRRYLDVLTGALILRQHSPWFQNVGKRQVKAPKVYVRDSGLLHLLLRIATIEELQGNPVLGASWEGFVVEQLLARMEGQDAYFWATHAGAELDLLLVRGQGRVGVEIKYTERPSTTKSMRVALDTLGLEHLYIVYPGDSAFPLDERTSAVPLAAALERLPVWPNTVQAGGARGGVPWE